MTAAIVEEIETCLSSKGIYAGYSAKENPKLFKLLAKALAHIRKLEAEHDSMLVKAGQIGAGMQMKIDAAITRAEKAEKELAELRK